MHQSYEADQHRHPDEGCGQDGHQEGISPVEHGGSGPSESGEEGSDSPDREHSSGSPFPGIKIEIGNIKSPAHQDEDHLEEKNRAGCDPDRHEGLHPFGFQVEPPVEHFHEGGIDRGTAKPKNCHPLQIEIKMVLNPGFEPPRPLHIRPSFVISRNLAGRGQ